MYTFIYMLAFGRCYDVVPIAEPALCPEPWL